MGIYKLNIMKVKIIDNFDEHIGYKENTILEIIEQNEDGYYILSSGHWCSEAELEFITDS